MNHTIAFVKAQAFDRETGEPAGESRVEEIDLKGNVFFKFAETPLQIKQIYESFWNDTNVRSAQIVFVQQVTFKK